MTEIVGALQTATKHQLSETDSRTLTGVLDASQSGRIAKDAFMAIFAIPESAPQLEADLKPVEEVADLPAEKNE